MLFCSFSQKSLKFFLNFGIWSFVTENSFVSFGCWIVVFFFEKKKRKSNNSPTPCNYIMELKMSQLIDGRFKFTKPKFISRNYLMDSKSCENKLKVFVLKIHTYTLHIRFGISQQTSISFGINRCKFNSSTVQTTLKS